MQYKSFGSVCINSPLHSINVEQFYLQIKEDSTREVLDLQLHNLDGIGTSRGL